MLTLTSPKPPSLTVPTVPTDHAWVEYAHAKGPNSFPMRKPHRVCKRCGVVCRPDTENAPCDPGASFKVTKPC